MDDVQLAPWVLLVPIYVVTARLRGSSWRRIVFTPTVMVLAALIEFGLPPMWHIDGVRRVVVIAGAASIAVCAVLILRRGWAPPMFGDGLPE
jgi:hypothetical protein